MSRHLTPLRYPGGKQRLTPFILEVLTENDCVGAHYVEPYAGGAGVAIDLLLSEQVGHIHLNDSSLPIYAFWKAATLGAEKLCSRISSASLTIEEWKKRRAIVNNPDDYDEEEVGFSALYLNRCNRSGVLSGGVIGGLAQDGEWKMDVRFSRKELICRIEAIASRREAITVTNCDAEEFIVNNIPQLPNDAFVYCDPPYFRKSGKLYLNHYRAADHARIAQVIQKDLPRKWLVSYDGVAEIVEYYTARRHFLYNLQYNASRVYKGKEVFIFSDDVKIPTRSALQFIDTALRFKAAGSDDKRVTV